MSKIRFILSGFKSQKIKFLLIFLVTFVTLLLFNISSSLRESVIDTRLSQLRETTQNSQISVSARDGTYKEFDQEIFAKHYLKNHSQQITDYITRDYCYMEVEGTEESLFLYGTDIRHQTEIYGFDLESGDVNNWGKNDVIISTDFAKEKKLQVGDTLKLKFKEMPVKLNVKAISKNEGLFLNAYDFAMTSTELVDEIGERQGLVNRIDLTISDLEQMDEITSEINESLEGTGLAATAKYNLSYFRAYVTTVVLALNLFSIFMLLLTVYMLYSLFQSYVYENVGQMATFRSIGYSIMEYRMILCSQAACTVVLAFLCSIGAMPFAMKLIGGMMFHQDTQVKFHFGILLLKGFAVLVIAVFSIYMASRKVSKTPVVSLIRNQVSYQKQSFHKRRLSLAILVLLGYGVIDWMNQRESRLVYEYAALITLLIAFLLFQELLIRVYGTLLNKALRNRKKSLGLFGKQVKTTLISYMPAVTSLIFVLSISICILSMSTILKQAMEKLYSGSDLYLVIYSSETEPCLDVLAKEKEIKNYIVEYKKSTMAEGDKVQITSIEENLTKEEYRMVSDCGDYKCFDELHKGSKAVVSDTLAKRWKKEEGDSISIADKKFEIVKIIKTFENMGEVIFLSEKSFQKTFSECDMCIVLAQAKQKENLETLRDSIQVKMDKVGDAQINTTEELCKSNIKANQVTINIIFMFACVILLVSGIGLCSVVMINILLRQREFVVFQTIGIAKGSILRIACLESGAVSLYAILNAVCIQKVLIGRIVEVLSYYVGNLKVEQNVTSSVGFYLLVFLATTGIFVGTTKKYALSNQLIEKIKVS